MSNITKWVLLFAAIAVFNSCKTVTTEPELGTATIQGRMELATQCYVALTPPYSGITVTVEGTNISTVTDDSGFFTLSGVPTGTYNIDFTKLGYGEIRWMSMAVAGGGSADVYWYNKTYVPMMFKISKIIANLQGVTFIDTTFNISVYGSPPYLVAQGDVTYDLSSPQSENAVIVFVSHTSDVSALPGHYSAFYCAMGSKWFDATIDTSIEKFTCPLGEDFLMQSGFKSGDSIYAVTYGSPYYSQMFTYGDPTYGSAFESTSPGDYFDPSIQQFVFTSINQTPSPVLGTKMP